MDYNHLTQDEQDEIVAEAIKGREREHFYYQINRDNYEHILTQLDREELPAEWPSHLETFKNADPAQLVTQLSGESLTLASRLRYRDQVRKLLQTETIEQSKCETAHTALCAKLPDKAAQVAAIERLEAKASSKGA
jgi:hypothetical protein